MPALGRKSICSSRSAFDANTDFICSKYSAKSVATRIVAGGFEAADELVGIGVVDETSFFVAFFGPGVGEVNVEAIDGGIGDTFGDIADGIGADYTDVSQIPPANPVNGKTVKFACPFNPDKIGVGLAFCLVYQKCPLA